jgi:hypothetical protein
MATVQWHVARQCIIHSQSEKRSFFVLFFSYRFTQIAVDPQIKTPGGKAYDVLFIGTGKLKQIHVQSCSDIL